ncbi:MAG: hypothetical protein NTV36_00295 [Candidatus Staskawiczbacteria bacterium]|nr:hypothetical protein [Candidatus Staskawiczbacteria bacterium]
MGEKESGKILEDIHKIEKDIHFYKTELLLERPADYVYEVRKLLTKAEDKKRHLTFELHDAEHKEKISEKTKIKK